MTTLTSAPKRPAWKLRPMRVEEYDALTEMGFFDGQSLELIEGELIEKMPQNEKQARAILLVQYKLIEVFGTGRWVRVQLPLAIENSKPEPDLAVVETDIRAPLIHPSTAILVVEVANSTLETDRENKASLYAKAGIEEYWIVNLTDNQLEVKRQPVAMPSAPYGFGYALTQIFQRGQSVSPLGAPDQSVLIDDLLP